jgi:hypothetical protein
MILDSLPLWSLYLAMTVAVLTSVETGFQFGKYRRRIGAAEKEGPVGPMVGATLALLAFLITFTFGIAASRFETRRQGLLDEANSIGTTYLRAGLLPESHRIEIQRLLREYVAARIQGAQSDQLVTAIARSEWLQKQLWSQATEVVSLDTQPIIAGLFVQSLNETIDLHTKRIHALSGRIPLAIWAVMGFVTVMAMTAAGYQEGLNSTCHSPVILALVLAFSVVAALIADLDRPHEGLLRVNQQIMIDLEKSMQPPKKE